MTPMMEQYFKIKNTLKPGTFLFYRVGDFYEFYHEDAEKASTLLNLTLTKKGDIPMSGVPHHAAEVYINRLIKLGQHVAICDQVGEVQKGQVVQREVTQILSPGTVEGDSKLNNYLAATYKNGIAYVDLSTGEFNVTETSDINTELVKLNASEVINEINTPDLFTNSNNLCKHFGILNLDGFSKYENGNKCAEAIFAYLLESHRSIKHIKTLKSYNTETFMGLDVKTIDNFELKTRLFEKLDNTKTCMGARLLQSWLLSPLINIELITNRQNNCIKNKDLEIPKINDIERLIGRISQGGTARDLKSLSSTLLKIKDINSQGYNLNEFKDITTLIEAAIVDEPSGIVKDGNMIKEGFDKILDEIKEGGNKGREWLLDLQAKLCAESGIKNLKIKYTSGGYFIEVPVNKSVPNIPSNWIRRQTMTNAERFTTSKLQEIEAKILGADEKSRAREFELFNMVRVEILNNIVELQKLANEIAHLDVYSTLGKLTFKGHVFPVLTNNKEIIIKDGRHPVIDNPHFVPNDTLFDKDNILLLITGPNMAGKSTYIRQVAVLVLLAQIGCPLPVKTATIGIVDKIFTRIGANDDLHRGQSTFMVEMNEAANIVNNATSNSLTILDEIGRGTSTYDGMVLAQGISEFLCSRGIRTLFATHYHELIKLEETCKGVVNYNVLVREKDHELVFLHKICRGGADKSYGIAVAKLAGMPDEIINRAKYLLENIESTAIKEDIKPVQLALF